MPSTTTVTEWIATHEPSTEVEFDVLEKTQFGFTIQHPATKEIFRCAVSWRGQTNWFRKNPAWETQS